MLASMFCSNFCSRNTIHWLWRRRVDASDNERLNELAARSNAERRFFAELDHKMAAQEEQTWIELDIAG
jgi:hypothetical protein